MNFIAIIMTSSIAVFWQKLRESVCKAIGPYLFKCTLLSFMWFCWNELEWSMLAMFWWEHMLIKRLFTSLTLLFNLSLLGVGGEIDILLKLIFKLKNSQFNYASLILIFCRKTLYHKTEKVHHRTLKVIYQSEESYENLLLESSSVSVHQRHPCFLVTKIYKSTVQINPEFMWPYFALLTLLIT